MYPLIYHKSLTSEKWNSYTKPQQILMIASELHRSKIRMLKKNNSEVNLAYERAFELIDLTVEDPKWKYATKEMLRLREVMGEIYCQTDKDMNLNNMCFKLLLSFHPETYNLALEI